MRPPSLPRCHKSPRPDPEGPLVGYRAGHGTHRPILALRRGPRSGVRGHPLPQERTAGGQQKQGPGAALGLRANLPPAGPPGHVGSLIAQLPVDTWLLTPACPGPAASWDSPAAQALQTTGGVCASTALRGCRTRLRGRGRRPGAKATLERDLHPGGCRRPPLGQMLPQAPGPTGLTNHLTRLRPGTAPLSPSVHEQQMPGSRARGPICWALKARPPTQALPDVPSSPGASSVSRDHPLNKPLPLHPSWNALPRPTEPLGASAPPS